MCIASFAFPQFLPLLTDMLDWRSRVDNPEYAIYNFLVLLSFGAHIYIFAFKLLDLMWKLFK